MYPCGLLAVQTWFVIWKKGAVRQTTREQNVESGRVFFFLVFFFWGGCLSILSILYDTRRWLILTSHWAEALRWYGRRKKRLGAFCRRRPYCSLRVLLSCHKSYFGEAIVSNYTRGVGTPFLSLLAKEHRQCFWPLSVVCNVFPVPSSNSTLRVLSTKNVFLKKTPISFF